MARLPYDSIIEVERTKSGLIISGDLCHSEIWGAELRGYGYPAHYAITETTERWTAQMIVIIVIYDPEAQTWILCNQRGRVTDASLATEQ